MVRSSSLRCIIISASIFLSNNVYSQDDLRIWREFIHSLKQGTISLDVIRPYKQLGNEHKLALQAYLDSVRIQASPEDWTNEPEVIQIDNRYQYIVPWTSHDQKVSYCFSFIAEDSLWYFQHLEAVFIRLDKIPPLPTSEFPDVSDQQKAWAREEIYWSYIITNFYLPIAEEKGKEYARETLRDGAGYFVGARTWVPFTHPQRAFILYLCWEQSNLRGNHVTLEKLEDGEAVVRLNTQFFGLYKVASHLKARITIEDYKQIFETIWQDRAFNAGWYLDIQYSPDYQVTFHFTR